jgi:ligand-binding SRPBCC domain-containing protein
MVYIRESMRIEAPVSVVWAWMSDLERLMTVNDFHVAMRFETDQRRGKGTRAVIDHSFFGSAVQPRPARVTHWEEGKGIGWVETDATNPRDNFPHSSQFRLEALGENATLLVDELRGSLNLPFGGRRLEKVAQDLFIARVMRRESAHLKEQIEAFAAGWREGSRATRRGGGEVSAEAGLGGVALEASLVDHARPVAP